MIALKYDEDRDLAFKPDQVSREIEIKLNGMHDHIFIDLVNQKGHLVKRRKFENTQKVDFKVAEIHPGYYSINLSADKKIENIDMIITD